MLPPRMRCDACQAVKMGVSAPRISIPKGTVRPMLRQKGRVELLWFAECPHSVLTVGASHRGTSVLVSFGWSQCRVLVSACCESFECCEVFGRAG